MKILDVTMHNYGSFWGEHTFKVADRGLVFVRGDNQDEPRMPSNGAGKSTTFDAIDWCLFGVVPKGDHVDSVINEEAGKDCRVTVRLWDEEIGKDAVIRRGRKPNELQFTVGGEQKTAMDAKVTQEKIESFLGLDRHVFHAAVYRSQGDEFDFANATDAEKKDLLSRIIPELQEIDLLRDRTKLLLDQVGEQQRSLTVKLDKANNEMAVIKGRNWEAQEAQWRNQQSARVHDAEAQMASQRAQLQEWVAQLEGESKLRLRLQQLQATPPQSLEFEAKQQLESHEAEIQQLYARVQVARAEEQRTNQQRQRLNQLAEGVCPTCAQPLTQAHLDQEKQRLAEVQSQLAQQRQQAEAQYQQAMETRQFLRSRSDAEAQRNQEKLSIHSAEIGAINAQLQNLIQLKRAHDQLERDLLRREGQLDLLKAETWPGLLQRQADDVRTTELLQEMADLDQAIYHDEERKRQFAFWLEAFGLKGLKSFILDSRLVDMTHAANEWVRVLTGGTHWIRFESQSLTRGGKLAEKFNVRVFRHNPDGSVADRGYRSYSGGEKRRIALGIDWGLSCLVASRASKQWGVLVLDECFKHLDPGGKEAFFELLEALKATRSSVFVIDHDEAMSGHFGMGIVIHRQGGRSRITDEESCSSPSSSRAMPATA